MKKLITEYFSTSVKDARRFIFLGIIVLGITLLPFFASDILNNGKLPVQRNMLSTLPELKKTGNEADHNKFNKGISSPETNTMQAELFYFDPNTVSDEGWRSLGLPEHNIRTIRKYLNGKIKFRKAEDLQVIYGLSTADFNRLKPYIRITSKSPAFNRPSYTEYKKNYTPDTTARKKYEYKPRTYNIVKVNTATAEQLEDLPGIGPAYASRIIKFRDALGGFLSVDQVAETFGLPDSTFEKIKPYLVVSGEDIRKRNINTEDPSEIKHPYINYKIVNAIIAYRKQHGNYSSIDMIKKIRIIDEELFAKISPYISVE